MSSYTPYFMLGALFELCGALTFFMVARGSDGSYSLPVAGFAAFLFVCGTAVSVWTAMKMAAEKRGR